MSAFGLIGEHLGHSMSPQLHAMLADYEYRLYETAPEALGEFLAETPLDGMNVTIPYKKAVIPYCSGLSAQAARLGSVNTLVRRDGGWFGANTDYDGFCYLLAHSGFSPRGKKGLVLGSGGGAKTVQAVLEDLGAAEIVEVSRRGENNYENLSKHADAQFIVNATPVGMYPAPEARLLTAADFHRCEAVFDLIYNPLRTELLRTAEQRGIIAENGLPMLAAQAVGSAALFLGHDLPEGTVEAALGKLWQQMRSIVLIGMPGCGKSTVGQILAEAAGKELLDTDAEITRKTGRSPAEIIGSDGESAFREIEAAVIAAVSQRTGLVIACGGGAVLRAENRAALSRNGTVIWLKRDTATLPTSGRPLSQACGTAALYARRAPIYASFAEHTVDNNGDAAAAAAQIMEVLK